ncbi:hypothetical protein ACQI4L_09010 [Mycolicibacterium litorale]|uniref:hypothetical protein n=1 Tax=Mycolicibacterium litorale TaxID=758802 RepID=UPI003CE71398
MTLLDRLDAHGADDPDFNEGHPEDRCPLDGRPVDEHRGGAAERRSTVWRHRSAAVSDLIARKLG